MSTPEGDRFIVTLWSPAPPCWTMYLESSRGAGVTPILQVPDTQSAKLRPSTIRVDGVAILKESKRMTKGTMEDVDESHTLPRHCQTKPSFSEPPSRIWPLTGSHDWGLDIGHVDSVLNSMPAIPALTIPSMGLSRMGPEGWGSNFHNWQCEPAAKGSPVLRWSKCVGGRLLWRVVAACVCRGTLGSV